jgi:hypothetical protein
MAPSEVAGLHALARAHGGSLTTNPDTGLPEAGFLKSILPMVIGAGLSVASGGTLTPLMAAMMTGGGYGLATGSLKKGLMAGLGAYGGAGLAGGLSAAGAAATTAETGLTASGGVMGANPMVAEPAVFGAESVGAAAPNGIGAAAGPKLTGYAANPEAFATNAYTSSPVSPLASVPTTTAAPSPIADNFSQASKGFQSLSTEAGRDAFMGNAASKGVEATGVGGGGGLMKYGYAAGLPMLMQDPEKQAEKPKDKPYEYTFDYGRVADPEAEYTGAATGQRTYFNPTFTRTAAGGGLMDIGPVQTMSDRNQAQMMMANGGQMYAEGGETKAVKPVEQNPYYTMSGQSGDAFKYLMGQMPASSKAPAPAPAAPAPAAAAPAPTQASKGFMGMGKGAGAATPTMRPYTFDPATGTFTAMPVIEATKPADPAMDYGAPNFSAANGGLLSLAQGGVSHLGDYSDGGRLLKGPGDGVSDSIPATIADKRPARLADGEFVVPARIVSELGNGSTEAGARKLYAMMDRVQAARKKSIGKNRVAVNSRSEKMLPA